MVLTILCGERQNVNEEVLYAAANCLPSLIIDGANYADPHRIMRYARAEVCDSIFVLETELIYKLRDVLSDLQRHMVHANTKNVFFTTFDALFHYQDSEENRDVYTQVWLLLRRASIQYNITVGVRAGSEQERFATTYARGAAWVTLS